MVLNLILILVFAGIFGFCMRDGVWTNTLRLINVILAATIASSFGEPMARVLSGMHTKSFFFHNILGVWLVFAFVCTALNEATKYISRVNVKFNERFNLIGGYVLAGVLAFVFVSFTLFTMHQAPLGKNFARGSFNADSRMFFGTAPDRQWHDYLWYVSQGAYSAGEARHFDPNDEYYRNYEKYRNAIENYAKEKGTLGVTKDTGFRRK